MSSVPDTTSQINFTSDQSAFDPSGVQFVLNPSDEAALMRALQLKEEVGAELTLVHVGLSDSEPSAAQGLLLWVLTTCSVSILSLRMAFL